MSEDIVLVHHGIKGMKWGVRRYQNKDGSFTDEGRRRYGFGRGRDDIITKNTQARIKSGAKLGAKIGIGYGGIMGISSGVLSASLLLPYFSIPTATVTAGSIALSSMLSSGVSGAVYGTAGGALVGTIETRNARKYIKKHDTGLSDFEKRDRN